MESIKDQFKVFPATTTVRCQEINGPGPMGQLNRPIRVRFRDKIESLLMGQVILFN
jgi:hypothetical protein